MRTDGSLLPSGAGRFDASTSVLAARLAGQPRNRSSTSANAIGRAGRRLRPKKKTRSGGAFSRGVRAATARSTSRARKALGDSRGRAAGSRRSATYTTRRARRCGRGRGSSSPARKRITKVDRQGVVAGDCSPVTASASRLAERGLRSARSRCPTSSRSALARVQQTSAPPSAGEQRQRLRHRGGCVTPGAVISPRLPLRWQSGSLSETARLATMQKRGACSSGPSSSSDLRG